jgi:hypothetical protein
MLFDPPLPQECFAQNYPRVVKKMQFLGNGKNDNHFTYNHGKPIILVMLHARHFSPTVTNWMDLSIHLGMSPLLQYSCSGEPFPNFLNPKRRLCQMPCVPFLSIISELTPWFHPVWQLNKNPFTYCGICCNMAMNVCHGQIQRNLGM